ncbi:hypothetical protein SPJ2_0094 [Streptococcus parauberis KRS-02109]|uniref:Uncharacterized protein n=1 Tax=Streptococcus parauberis KRS-02083 TaxID=1207545 RepID=A0ABN0IUC7_9STRE|nr:hypothetical protein SPJ2_0094 [Streptococcus parauberis KRS-02109]EMG26497.1 hypothetical protein SPJ1_0459 [Streptococcus parauberis KRS-02083]
MAGNNVLQPFLPRRKVSFNFVLKLILMLKKSKFYSLKENKILM